MFAKRHYETIAAEFKLGRTLAPLGEEDTHDALVRQFADMFARDNPRFDRGRFIQACGTPEGASVR